MDSLPRNQFYGKLTLPLENFQLEPISTDAPSFDEIIQSMAEDVQLDLDSGLFFIYQGRDAGYTARMTCAPTGRVGNQSFDLNVYVPFKDVGGHPPVLAVRGPNGHAQHDYVLRDTIARGLLGGRTVYHTAYILSGLGCSACEKANRACFRILKSPAEWSPCVGCAKLKQSCHQHEQKGKTSFNERFSTADIGVVSTGQRWFFGLACIEDEIPHPVEAELIIPRQCDQSHSGQQAGPVNGYEDSLFRDWQEVKSANVTGVPSSFTTEFPTQGPRVNPQNGQSKEIEGDGAGSEENGDEEKDNVADDEDQPRKRMTPRYVSMSAIAVKEKLYEKGFPWADTAKQYPMPSEGAKNTKDNEKEQVKLKKQEAKLKQQEAKLKGQEEDLKKELKDMKKKLEEVGKKRKKCTGELGDLQRKKKQPKRA